MHLFVRFEADEKDCCVHDEYTVSDETDTELHPC
jgi:hypothetical protein